MNYRDLDTKRISCGDFVDVFEEERREKGEEGWWWWS